MRASSHKIDHDEQQEPLNIITKPIPVTTKPTLRLKQNLETSNMDVV